MLSLTGTTDNGLITLNGTAPNATVESNLTFDGTTLNITGNLNVTGTQTSVNTETILLADNIITLNSNFTTGTPSEDGGIEVLRGSSATKKFFWDESADRWLQMMV